MYYAGTKEKQENIKYKSSIIYHGQNKTQAQESSLLPTA